MKILSVTTFLIFVAWPTLALAQQTSPSASPSTAPQASQTSSTAPTAPPASAPTSGPITIESTILADQVLDREAQDLALYVSTSTSSHAVFIGTPADISAVLQLRATVAQANLLKARLDYLKARLGNFQCAQKKPTAPPPSHVRPLPPGISAVLPASFSDLVTAIQTAASIAQVSQTIVAGTGSLTDDALISMVAGDITASKVYVPSKFPPGIAASDLKTTLLGRIFSLETSRNDVLVSADAALGSKCDSTNGSYKALSSEITATAKSVDSFEASLFGAQAPSQTTDGKAPSTVIQQLLYADLFLSSILSSSDPEFLSLHTIDSGGDTLTRSSLFTGSRDYYSGGVTSTFTLYNIDGRVICSGLSYGYRGYVQDKGMSAAIANPADAPAIGESSSSVLVVPTATPGASASPAPGRFGCRT